MYHFPIAAQLYSVRKDFADQPLGTLKALKAMGYQGVEFAGAAVYSPEFYAALLKESGMVCCGWHTPWEAVQDDAIQATIRLNQAVGNKYIVLPFVPGETAEDFRQRGRDLNHIADLLAPYGMRIGYLCHPGDFEVAAGDPKGLRHWDLLLAEADFRVVIQLDLGNAMKGGADVLAELKKYPYRSKSIHCKPYSYSKGDLPLIGEDDCPWKEVMQFCRDAGDTEWCVIEYEAKGVPVLEAMEKNLKNLKEFA